MDEHMSRSPPDMNVLNSLNLPINVCRFLCLMPTYAIGFLWMPVKEFLNCILIAFETDLMS